VHDAVRRPERQRDAPAGAEHAGELVERPLLATDVEEDEAREDGVEARVRERQALGTAAAEVDVGVRAAGERHHARRLVDADHVGPARGRSCRELAGAGADVENALPLADLGRVEQLVEDLRGDLGPGPRVGVGLLVPPAGLEGVERIGVVRRHADIVTFVSLRRVRFAGQEPTE
jgi:hypothetical protein